MGLPLKFTDTLPTAIARQFESIVAILRADWFVEHGEHGTHGDITATSLSLSGNVESSLTAPNQPICFATLDADQALATGVQETLVWRLPVSPTTPSTDGYDSLRILQPTTAGGLTGTVFTPTEPGTYLITVRIRWEAAGATTGVRKLFLRLAGTTTDIAADEIDGSTGNPSQSVTRAVVWPNEEWGTTGFIVEAYQNSGGDLDVLRQASRTGWVQIIKLW